MKFRACVLIATSTPSLLFAQGPLTPPTGDGPAGPTPALSGGVPQASMKTLHEVRPSTPINSTTTPGDGSTHQFAITTSGSYHLTGNLSTSLIGIRITAADVLLDLGGFQISDSGGGLYGIEIGVDADRCTIRNGTIADFNFGVFRVLSGMDEAGGGSFIDLAVTGHSSIALLGGNGWTVHNCRVHGGGNSGIVVGEGCVVSHSTVREMTASAGTNGIEVREGSTISNCAVTECDVIYGIRTGEGCTVENSVATGNDSTAGTTFSFGFLAGSRTVLRGCTAALNSNSAVGAERGAGISAEFSCLVVDCMANKNDGAGIIVSQASEVRNCKVHFNGQGGTGAGIYGLDFDTVGSPTTGWNKIVGNDSTFNIVGIDLETTANLVIENSSRGNDDNYVMVADNNVGPIIGPGTSGAISGFGIGQAAGVGTTDPWANFSW